MGVDPESGSPSESLFWSRIHPDDLPRVRKAVEDSLASRRPFDCEFRIASAGDGTRWLMSRGTAVADRDGRPVRMCGVDLDITRIKQQGEAERISSATKACARTAAEMILAIPDAAVLLDQSLTVIGANQPAEAMFGMPATQSTGRNMLDLAPQFLDEHDLGTAARHLREIATGRIPRLEPMNIRTPDGRRLVTIAQAGYLKCGPESHSPTIVLTFRDVSDLHEARNQALRNQAHLRSLAARLASSEEESRWRVSRQIHDTVIQTLSLTKMKLAALIDHGNYAGNTERSELKEINDRLGTAISECRHIMADLNPPLLYELGLVPALRDLASKFRALHGVLVSVEEKKAVNVPQRPLRGLLFHATRELIMNAVKHAASSRINVSIEGIDGHVRVVVQDDGHGFDPEHIEHSVESQTGFGLFSIRERLDGLGGRLEIASRIGSGTTASITLPVERPGGSPETASARRERQASVSGAHLEPDDIA
jgi:PAS domain S-box-containing protein